MKLIHMSDIHLTTPGREIFGRDPLLNFERALDQVRADHRDAELMVISGDFSDFGDLADYHLLRERLNGFPIPVRFFIGNHNHRETFLSMFLECADADGFAQALQTNGLAPSARSASPQPTACRTSPATPYKVSKSVIQNSNRRQANLRWSAH